MKKFIFWFLPFLGKTKCISAPVPIVLGHCNDDKKGYRYRDYKTTMRIPYIISYPQKKKRRK